MTVPSTPGKPKASEAGAQQKKPQIDPEFRKVFPPQSPEERATLTADLLANGCREPLVVWKGKGILVDGYNRFDVCEEHDLPYAIVEMEFDSRQAVRSWIISNQLGRRNLHPEATAAYRGLLLLTAVEQAEESEEDLGQDVRKATAKRLAEEWKVDPKTIERDGAYASSLDTLVKSCGDEVRQKILSRQVRLSRAELKKLADKPPATQKRLVAQLLADGKLKKPSAPKPSPADSLTRVWKKVKEADRQEAIEGLLADEAFSAMLEKAKKAPGRSSRSDEDE